jgi:FMN phosphatase YigB (HAD superfamily)
VLLTDYKVLTFDCYGTLIDWETGIWDAYQPLLMANNCSEITREQTLEDHAKLESKQQLETPDVLYSELL